MTDDRSDPAPMDELGELLSLADHPLHFPEPERSDLHDHFIRTASMPRAEVRTVVPLVTGIGSGNPPHRAWIVGVAASLALILAVGLALVARQDGRSNVPVDQAPMTIDEACDALPPLAVANGLDQGSVQIADVSLDEIDELRRLIAGLSVDEGGPVASELTEEAITRIQLMEISIEAGDTDAAVNAMTAARASVGTVINQAC